MVNEEIEKTIQKGLKKIIKHTDEEIGDLAIEIEVISIEGNTVKLKVYAVDKAGKHIVDIGKKELALRPLDSVTLLFDNRPLRLSDLISIDLT